MTKLEELNDLRIKTNEAKEVITNLRNELDSLKRDVNNTCMSLIDYKENCNKLETFIRSYSSNLKDFSFSNSTKISIVDNNFCYNITLYSLEINFEVIKDNVRIGNFYYWFKNKNNMGDIQISFDDINKAFGERGIVLDYVEDFLDAFKNFFDNIDSFLKKMEILYDNELIKKEKSLDENLTKAKQEEKDLQSKYDSWLKDMESII